eukprot:1985586-Rhodomonas_salina.1
MVRASDRLECVRALKLSLQRSWPRQRESISTRSAAGEVFGGDEEVWTEACTAVGVRRLGGSWEPRALTCTENNQHPYSEPDAAVDGGGGDGRDGAADGQGSGRDVLCRSEASAAEFQAGGAINLSEIPEDNEVSLA